MDIYVGNLPYNVNEEQLQDMFVAHGSVSNTKIAYDRESGRSKGFGFVTMLDKDEAQAAIDALNGSELSGRNIRVNEARPRNESQGGPRRSGGGYQGGGGRDRNHSGGRSNRGPGGGGNRGPGGGGGGGRRRF